jgi:hypothetical protein
MVGSIGRGADNASRAMRTQSATADRRNGNRSSRRGWPFRDDVWRRMAATSRTETSPTELYCFIRNTQLQIVGSSTSGFASVVRTHNDPYLAMKCMKTNVAKHEPQRRHVPEVEVTVRLSYSALKFPSDRPMRSRAADRPPSPRNMCSKTLVRH